MERTPVCIYCCSKLHLAREMWLDDSEKYAWLCPGNDFGENKSQLHKLEGE